MKNISKVYGRWLWIIMAVCLPQIADGKVYHVSAEAEGTGNGSEESPFGSLQSAANVAGAGDTVYVAGGVYARAGHGGSRIAASGYCSG